MTSLSSLLTAAALSVSLTLPAGAAPEEAAAPEPGKTVARAAEVKGEKESVTLHYWEHLPEGAAPADGWPLLVFLHGSGERGTDLAVVKKHGPLRELGHVKELERFLLIAPQCPPDRWWDVAAVRDLIEKVSASRPVDRTRIYVTGLSMGGFGTWGILAADPGLCAAAAPVCGGGDPSTADKFKNVPLWVFHGGKDEAVPVLRSQEMVDALTKAGGHPKFTLYPDAPHDSWTETYRNPALYEWFLQHRKGE